MFLDIPKNIAKNILCSIYTDWPGITSHEMHEALYIFICEKYWF